MGKVGIVMGSTSDLPVVDKGIQILKELGDQYIERFDQLPEWAKPEVRVLLDKGYIKGTSAEDPDDIKMFMSDIRTLIVAGRMMGL